jgi:hypothetical protein
MITDEIERNKKVVEDFVREVPLAGNLDALDELVAEDYVQHNPQAGQGRAGVRELFGNSQDQLDHDLHSHPSFYVISSPKENSSCARSCARTECSSVSGGCGMACCRSTGTRGGRPKVLGALTVSNSDPLKHVALLGSSPSPRLLRRCPFGAILPVDKRFEM